MGLFKRLFLVGGLIVIGMLVLSGSFQLNNIRDGSSFSLPDLNSIVRIKDKFFSQFDSDKTAEPEPVSAFKWQDEEGVWHFGDVAPEDVVVEAIVVEPVATVEFNQPNLPARTEEPSADLPTLPTTPNDYFNRSLQTLEDAKQVESLLQEQDDQRRKILENM